jgi:membrane associated rhomboid family serine protease
MFAMFQKDPQKIRYILLGNMSSWVIYFIAPFSTSIFAQIAGIISSVIGILRYRKTKTDAEN